MPRRSGWSEERREHERELKRAREAEKRRRLNPDLPPYVPGFNPTHTPRGPSGSYASNPAPHIHEGHELAKQSINIDEEGGFAGRWDKTRIAAHPAQFEPVPSGHLVTKTTTYLGEDARPRAQYITAKPHEVERWKAFEAAVARMIEGIPPLPSAPMPLPNPADALNVLKLSDAHLGALIWGQEAGADHDLAIGARDLRTAGRALIDRAPDASRCIVASLGDFFHAQDDNQRTPRSGHKLDVDTRFAKIFEVGLEVLRDLIGHALTRFPIVRFLAVPGNHDPQMAFMIASMLGAWYRNEPRVEISPSRKPFAFFE